ncbi:hypothetical protein D3C78_1590180 [compost metagenome]
MLVVQFIFLLLQFGVSKGWKYYYLIDLFVNDDKVSFTIKNNNDETELIKKNEILTVHTKYGITTLNTINKQYYLLMSSKSNSDLFL